ncbi:hypothetical protein PR048_023191 [Dryococelus australis]|uniref:Uncharacterized protein n=1 Tax=Dryococelus australis TaxID=614101 RepID=A0ABQ9GTD0_9NEOP|nr:hypothetical protein PR048_023191 [Dryococelus australis]
MQLVGGFIIIFSLSSTGAAVNEHEAAARKYRAAWIHAARPEHYTPIRSHSLAHSGDGALDACDSVALIAPALLGLEGGKTLQCMVAATAAAAVRLRLSGYAELRAGDKILGQGDAAPGQRMPTRSSLTYCLRTLRTQPRGGCMPTIDPSRISNKRPRAGGRPRKGALNAAPPQPVTWFSETRGKVPPTLPLIARRNPLVRTVFDTSWRTLALLSPSTVTADNQCAVDVGIFVHKTVGFQEMQIRNSMRPAYQAGSGELEIGDQYVGVGLESGERGIHERLRLSSRNAGSDPAISADYNKRREERRKERERQTERERMYLRHNAEQLNRQNELPCSSRNPAAHVVVHLRKTFYGYHKHIAKKWSEALSSSKQTRPGRPSAPDITAGNTANEIFVVVTLHQQDVQRWGRAVRRHSSSLQFTTSWTRFRVVRLLASHLGESGSNPGGVAPGFSHVGIVTDSGVWRTAASCSLVSGRNAFSLHSLHAGHWLLLVVQRMYSSEQAPAYLATVTTRHWCRSMPPVGGFPRRSPVSTASSFRRCSTVTSLHPRPLSNPRY